MQVIYLDLMANKRVAIISYTFLTANNVCKVRPNKQVFTESGIHFSKDYKRGDKVTPEDVVLGSFEFSVENLLDYLLELCKETTHFVFTNNDAKEFIRYIQIGKSETGLQDRIFTGLEDKVKALRENLTKTKITKSYHSSTEEGHIIDRILLMLSNNNYDLQYKAKELFKNRKFNHPFLHGRYIIVEKDKVFEDPELIRLSVVNYPSATEICRPLPDVFESIIYLREIPKSIRELIDRMIKELGSDNRVFVIPIDLISDTIGIRLFEDSLYRLKSENTSSQFAVTSSLGDKLAYTVYPPALSSYIKEINNYYLENDKFTKVDIMDKIYTIDTKGKRIIRPEIPMSGMLLTVQADGRAVNLLLGYDILERNRLKRIEKQITELNFYYRIEEKLIRYKTEAILNNGERMQMHSKYSGFTFI